VLAERLALTQFDEPINIQYTSGTTGFPKGATLSHHNILNNGFFIGEGCRYTAADRVCVPVPFYHCFGMVLGNLAIVTHGATIVIPNYSFDAAATMRAVVRERCTSLYGVPTMFIAELGLPDFADYDCATLRTGIMAGLAVSGRDHEAGAERDAHARGHDLLRHDRNVARLDADRGRRSARQAHGHGRPRPSTPRGQGRRRAEPGRALRNARRAVHARL
jgi:acyl-CoA synthetase (AMP-forming)/AMP-acid ligase II